MSYCRFSSDDFKSDVYAFPSEGGYEIHVSTMRYMGDIPKLPLGEEVTPEQLQAAYLAQIAFLKKTTMERIDLPLAGEMFQYTTLEEFEKRLRSLREIGYHVPESAFARIAKELEAQGANGNDQGYDAAR